MRSEGGPPRSKILRSRLLAALVWVTAAAMLLAASAPAWYAACRKSDPGGSTAQQAALPAAADGRFDDQYLAVCVVAKDEHPYMHEWIAHHAALGVGKFYVIDHGSSPPLSGVLRRQIATGLVDYSWWDPGDFTSAVVSEVPEHYAQMDMYDACLRRHGHEHRFMAFIDVDEFIIIKRAAPTGPSLPALLRHFQAFDEIGGLAIQWQLFGSSGHTTRPSGGVLQAYTKCIPFNSDVNGRLVKSIVNTKYAAGCLSAHHFEYNSSMHAVNERFQRVDTEGSDPQTGRWVVVQHFITRSREEWEEKLRRGSASGITRPPEWFEEMDARASEDCLDGASFGPYP